MSAVKLLAPAKLNLFLHITRQLPNGYHELQTLFQLLDYGDDMEFTVAESGELALHLLAAPENAQLPLDDNLIIRAALQLREQAGNPGLGASISLHKRIPLGAGLGGGSANAAMTLLALNDLWQLGLSEAELCEIGVNLGADVPVFIRGKSAWAEGIGEQLQPVELPEYWYLVLTPACGVSTAEIFSHKDLTRNSQAIKIADFLAGETRNDCQAVTEKVYPEVHKALIFLNKYAEARMTGTGSSIFARFPDEESAVQVLAKTPPELQGFVAKGINSLEHRYIAT